MAPAYAARATSANITKGPELHKFTQHHNWQATKWASSCHLHGPYFERSKLTQIHFLTEYTLAVALFPLGALTLHSIHSLTLQVLPTTKWVFYFSLSLFSFRLSLSLSLSLTFGSTSKIQVWRVSEVTSHTLYPNGKVQIRSQTVERGERERKRKREKRKGRERLL